MFSSSSPLDLQHVQLFEDFASALFFTFISHLLTAMKISFNELCGIGTHSKNFINNALCQDLDNVSAKMAQTARNGES